MPETDGLDTAVVRMQGSTVIDFAYALGTAVGDRMVGAKVNEQWAPMGQVLQEADVVDIVTSDAPPSAVSVSQRAVGAALEHPRWA